MSRSDNSTVWNKAGVIARWVSILLVIAAMIGGTAWALHAQVSENTADIRTLKEAQADMRREVHDLWMNLLSKEERSKKE